MTRRATTPLALALLSIAITWPAAAQQMPSEPKPPFMPEGRPLEGLVVTLDAAGGGSPADPNTPRAGGFSSDDLNMLIAGHLYHHLKHAGAVVHMTRWDDGPVAASDAAADGAARARRAVETHSHLLISIRVPGDQPDGFDGIIVRTQPDAGGTLDGMLLRRLATHIAEGVLRRFPWAPSFDVRFGDCPLAAAGEVPTVVVEVGRLRNPDFVHYVEGRGDWRPIAIGLYNGVAQLWKEERAALDARRKEHFPDATTAPTTQPATTDEPPSDAANTIPPRVRQAVADLWRQPRPPQTADDAEWLLNQYFRRTLTDHTFFYVRTQVARDGDTWVIRGATNFGRLADAAVSVLREAGCGDVKNAIEPLPAARLGDERFGVVTATMAMTWSEPRDGGRPQTQLLLGESVYLLDESADHNCLLLHASDGYVGWVRATAVRRMTAEQFDAWTSHPAAVFKHDVVADGIRIPAGASLPIARGAIGDRVSLRLLPSYNSVRESDEVLVPASDLNLPPDEPPGRAVAETATNFITTPYVFGGRNRLGIDCSGLTGVAYGVAGLELPRDARQQILVGRLAGTPWRRTALGAGDLLFFCDESGTVIHTGVSLGGSRFVHAAPPEVQVSSLDPNDALYHEGWARAFAFARRPFNR